MGSFVLVLLLENADVLPSERSNKIITGDSLFAAEAQHIEHEHDDEHVHERTAIFATGFSSANAQQRPRYRPSINLNH